MEGLITLPIRLTARAASIALRGTESALSYALGVATRVTGAAGGRAGPDPAASRSPASAETVAEDASASARITERPEHVEQQPEQPDRYAETPPDPVHVSAEPSLVEEFAEPGAEDGAGAQVTVEEPWTGYSKLHADDLIARVGIADPAELAAVSLYERAHQNRQTVLSAVERQLQLTAGGGSPRLRKDQSNG
jgi:hypothetical protein